MNLNHDNKRWQEIGKRLREAREEKSMTQEEVAKEAGITASYFARIERGEKHPKLTVLEAIFKALKVKSSDILPF